MESTWKLLYTSQGFLQSMRENKDKKSNVTQKDYVGTGREE